MKILITGAAGFIGYHVCLKLANSSHQIVGIDNINSYYDTKLKLDRLKELGFNAKEVMNFNKRCLSTNYNNLNFLRIDISDNAIIDNFFASENFDVVCNLAAQAGVRYSISNPKAYIDSNINGFLNILEGCRNYNVKHLVYASSSSIYGKNKKVPFEIKDKVDQPISLYAATKKSNELMAHTYSHLFNFKTTGLRFFTVYGPWGRPDMAYYLFTDAILKNNPIKVFNNGKMERDFTYIDDIVIAVIKIIERNVESRENYKIYNIGNNKTENLKYFIEIIENTLNKKALKKMYPMQQGDVLKTYADISDLKKDYDYSPNTDLSFGIKNFVDWFKKYHY